MGTKKSDYELGEKRRCAGVRHNRDLQPKAFQGPYAAGYPTAGPERRLTAAYETEFRGTLNAHT